MKHRRFAPVLAAVALFALSSCSMQSMVYPGSRMQLPDAACGYPTYTLELPTEDGTSTLHGWFFNRGANTPLVVMFGGNAQNVGTLANIAAADPSRSYLLMNYRGYGDSTGEPSQKTIVADARYSIRYARAAMGNPAAQLYLAGFSLGSAVATHVAISEQPAGIVLICPFDNARTVACNVVPLIPRIMPLDPWDSVRVAPQITCPVTIMQANYDKSIPEISTQKLIQAFRTPPIVHKFDADHNNIFTATGFRQLLLQAMPVTEHSKFDF